MNRESGNTTNSNSLTALREEQDRSIVMDHDKCGADYPVDKTIVDLFEAQAARTPGQTALLFEQQRLTYGELNHRADQLANHLRQLGAGPDVLVGLFVERSLDMMVGLLGILKAGAAYVPMDTALPQERIAYMLADASVTVVLSQTSLMAFLPASAAQVVCLDSFDWTNAENPKQSDSRPCPKDLAYVIYTSGSTGRPKGVCIEHRNVVNYVLGVSERFQFKAGMNHATVSTIAADLGNTVIFPALATGGCLHIISQGRIENQALLSDYFKRENIDVLKIVPSHLAALQTGNNPEHTMPRSRLIVGGEASRLDWIERLRLLSPNCEIYNHYGPTETTVGVLTYHVGAQLPSTPSGTLPLGKPLPNSRVYILDEHRQPVPAGVPGELYIGGRGVARGYLNRPDLTAEKFVPDPFSPDPGGKMYRTGDRGSCLPDGNIEFCGRIDHQVKIRGHRVELGEIEGALCELHGVQDAVVSTWEDASGNNELVAYVVPKRPKQPLWGNKSLYTLPDGSTVAHLNRNETTYIYNEIFVLQAYLRHGITIHDGDCIVDAGSNIGLFTVFASRLARNLRIICFEPNPAVYACLKANAEAWGAGVKCLPLGLSGENKFAEMTFFEGFSLLSGFYADEATEREVVKTYALNQESESGNNEQLAAGIGKLLEDRFHAKTETAQLRTLSSVIAEEGIERIDLLKINVEKSELDVLIGINASDWPKIRQLVIEVDLKESLEPITALLVQQGYEVLAEQDPLLRKTELCYVYAIRPSAGSRLVRQRSAKEHVRSLPPVSEEVLTPTILRKFLKERVPQYMVPSTFMLLEKFPLTANGKIDRQALPAPECENIQPARDFVRPRTEIEKALALIWTELLKVDNIGTNDAFFDLGGHSLLAIRAVSRIRDVFGVDIPIQTLFENSTIAGLASVLNATKSSGTVQRIERRTPSASPPLSFAQEQLRFLDQLTPGSPVYNMGDIVDFCGKYNGEAMRKAIKELLLRHEILRTAFSDNGGQGVQIISPEMDLPLAELDLSALAEQEREREWTRVVHEQGRKPFDLSQAPLLRATMVHLSAHEHRLLLTTHHILGDEWSMEVIHEELKRLYDAFSEGRPSPLPKLPIQYADFACWQRNRLQGAVQESLTAYWKEELAGARFVLELPTDKQRPATTSFRGAMETFQLPEKLLGQLKTLGREQQATLFMVLEAGFMALLYRYTGQDDIIVGTPISVRTHSETENLIGLFLNTVLLRAKFREHQNFLSLLQQIRERALGAYAHPDLPFANLVAELAPDRDPSRTPLFQVMFVLHNSEGVSQVSRAFGNKELGTGTSKFDLSLILSENEKGLDGLIEYSTDLFEVTTIRRMLSHFQILLEGIVKNPEEQLSKLPLLTDDEREQLLIEPNQTEVAGPKDRCLYELIEEQVVRTPDQVALVFEHQRLSYAELNRRANQLAHHLQGLGVGPEILVGLFVQRSLEMIVGLLAILKAGGAYVPMDPGYPKERIRSILEDSKPLIVLTQTSLVNALPDFIGQPICLDSGWAQITAQSEENPVSQAKPENLAYVLFTSGSMGRPKGVALEHRSAVAFIQWANQTFTPKQLEGVLFSTSVCFDLSVFEMFVTLSAGGKIIIAPDILHLPNLPAKHEITLINTVPSAMAELLRTGCIPDSVKTVNLAGEALPDSLVDQIYSSTKADRVYNLYGPTETTTYSTYTLVPHGRPVTIGKPIANTQAYILDANRRPVPIGVMGELYLAGAGLARGYYGRPDLTSERFVPNPFSDRPDALMYRTGDICTWLSDRDIRYVGRADHQVKLRGFRIELGEIETALSHHENVRQCVVVAREDAPGDQRLVAYFEPRTETTPTVSELRAYLAKGLPDYMVPASFVPLEKLPLTPNGKIDRKALPAPDINLCMSERSYVAPRNETEQKLAELWAQVLRLERVGIRDNFFHLGGHSLTATQLISRIRAVLGVKTPLRSLFEAPTVAGFAEYVQAIDLTLDKLPGSPVAIGPHRELIEI